MEDGFVGRIAGDVVYLVQVQPGAENHYDHADTCPSGKVSLPLRHHRTARPRTGQHNCDVRDPAAIAVRRTEHRRSQVFERSGRVVRPAAGGVGGVGGGAAKVRRQTKGVQLENGLRLVGVRHETDSDETGVDGKQKTDVANEFDDASEVAVVDCCAGVYHEDEVNGVVTGEKRLSVRSG